MVENLDVLRKKIDSLDRDMIKILGMRMKVVKKVGEFKKKHNIQLCNKKRQEEVLKMRIKQSEASGLDESFVEKLYNLIFYEAIKVQRRIK